MAAADVACLTGDDFGAAMREVLRQFEISCSARGGHRSAVLDRGQASDARRSARRS